MQCHVTRRAVQGYEKANLLQPSSKDKRGYLLYDEMAKRRVLRIKRYQQYGFTLKEIERVFSLSDSSLKEELILRHAILLHQRMDLNDIIQLIEEEMHSL